MTDWKTIELGKVCTLQRGMDLPKRMRTEGDFPLVTSSGIDGTHSIGPVKGPGVITGRYGTIGKVFFVDSDFWPLNTTLYVRDFHGNDPRFIHYLLQTVDFQSHSGKSGVPGVNRNDVHQDFVHIPVDCSEQESIAKTLLDADALIDSLDQLLTKKRQIKEGAMQELLTGRRRLSGFVLEWSAQLLRDIAEMKSGEAITSEQLSGTHPYPCFGGNGLRGYAESFTHDGQFALVGRQGALCGNVALARGKFFASEHAVVVTPGASVDIVWLHYVLVRMDLNQYSESSAQPGLSVERLMHLNVLVPELSEQTAIAKVLADIDAEVTALESQLTKARAVKQAMAQALLTGRIRLPIGPQELAAPVPPPQGVSAPRSAPVRAQEPTA